MCDSINMTIKHTRHQNLQLHNNFWMNKSLLQTHTNADTAIKNQSPSLENNSFTGGRDLQMGLCCEASQIMFYSLKVFLTVKEKSHGEWEMACSI